MIKIIGDGGHARVVWDVVDNHFQSWVSRKQLEFPEKYTFVAVGSNEDRRKEARKALRRNKKIMFAVWIHKRAIFAENLKIGPGTVIMAGAVVQPDCFVGKHCILNTNCSVDHGCTIGDFAHIAPGAVLCGNVTVGEGALIGAGAVCVPGAVIPPWSLVKAGTVAK